MTHTMRIPTYHVNAFTDTLFSGNPAAVCLLPKWLEANALQKIARENNMPVTAFLVHNDKWEIRWFTPEYELELCGHGTMAAACVFFSYLEPQSTAISFHSPKGVLNVNKIDDWITLTFPAKPIENCSAPNALIEGLGIQPLETYQQNSERYLVLLENENQVKNLAPNISILKQLQQRGIIVTAPGENVDFVSRTFYPHKNMYIEDAVTGASHCLLAPFWADLLNKETFFAKQLSSRGGFLKCGIFGAKVLLSGKNVLFQLGEIFL